MPNKPRKWQAALLGFFIPPIAMMYVAQARWALIYLFAILIIWGIGWFYLHGTVIAAVLPYVVAVICAAHAYRFAERYPDEMQSPAYSRWYWLLGAMVGYFVVVFGMRAFVVELFRAPSGSMLPTIPARANLLVQKWGYGNYGAQGINLFRTPISSALSRGDIIVFEFPPNRSMHFVKRLVGLPGDTVAYHGKTLSINGKPVERRPIAEYFDAKSTTYTPAFIESLMGVEYAVLIDEHSSAYIPTPSDFPFRDKCTYGPDGASCVVPAGHYFTMGDNRGNSNDSRIWGFVPANHIVGKVLHIVH